MKQSELLGILIPGVTDLIPIINNIREKYQIPEIRPDDELCHEAAQNKN
jgi:hypothetical protein